MDKHLKSLAPRYLDAKFIKVDAEVCFCDTVLTLLYSKLHSSIIINPIKDISGIYVY